jgi:hypothetical protein
MIDKENEFSVERREELTKIGIQNEITMLGDEEFDYPEEYDDFDELPNMTFDLDNFIERSISPVELGIINQYMFDTYKNGSNNGITVLGYGGLYNKKFFMNGVFDNSRGWWFQLKLDSEPDNQIYFQTGAYFDRNDRYVTELSLTCSNNLPFNKLSELIDNIKKIAFNNSRFKGKCLEVEIRNGMFEGVKVIDVKDVVNELILNDSQNMFMNHFIKRLKRGKNMRILLNGVPGTGKTELIRKIISELMPQVTFVIPRFNNIDDLRTILTSCEIFDNGTIIMDDIDLFIGSRQKGNYTNVLGEFLNFFDGIKKRQISILASTNDKTLVDEAAERPGRFNAIIDFDYLSDDAVIKVCDIHFDERWKVKEVYDALTGNIDGKKAKITGAFIANLSNNLNEMYLDYEEDGEEWTLEHTLGLIRSSYKGFYSSQVSKSKRIGFSLGDDKGGLPL